MTDLEICLNCGEEMTYWYVIQGSVIFECPDCDYDGSGEGLDDGQEPCLCREDTVNPFCPGCY